MSQALIEDEKHRPPVGCFVRLHDAAEQAGGRGQDAVCEGAGVPRDDCRDADDERV